MGRSIFPARHGDRSDIHRNDYEKRQGFSVLPRPGGKLLVRQQTGRKTKTRVDDKEARKPLAKHRTKAKATEEYRQLAKEYLEKVE